MSIGLNKELTWIFTSVYSPKSDYETRAVPLDRNHGFSANDLILITMRPGGIPCQCCSPLTPMTSSFNGAFWSDVTIIQVRKDL